MAQPAHRASARWRQRGRSQSSSTRRQER